MIDKEGNIICCDSRMSSAAGHDDPKTGFAFNLYLCDYCGTIVRENVWDNKGYVILKPGSNTAEYTPMK
jgi:hypothetical protein